MAAGASTVAGGVTTPLGFRAAGVSAGIKANNALDLALLVADQPATAAAVFTTNRAQAAPVVLSREHLRASGGTARAIIVNSGCANACTGSDGMRAATEMAAETARLLGGHLCCGPHAVAARAGVCAAAVDDDRPCRAAGGPEMFTREDHRRRLGAAGCEHRCGRGRLIGNEQREIESV